MRLPGAHLTSSIRVRLFLGGLLLIMVSSASAQNPDFSLPGLDQQPVRLADFRGRWVVVNFWATWCTPCLLEMPELQAFHQQHRHRATVIGINHQDLEPGEIRAFAERLGIDFPIALSQGQPIAGFPLKGLPTTFLISPTGQLIDTHLGTVNATMLAQRLDEFDKRVTP